MTYKKIASNIQELEKYLESGSKIKIKINPDDITQKVTSDLIDINDIYLAEINHLNTQTLSDKEPRSIANLLFKNSEGNFVLVLSEKDIVDYEFYDDSPNRNDFLKKATTDIKNKVIDGFFFIGDILRIISRDGSITHASDFIITTGYKEAIEYLEELKYKTTQIKSIDDVDMIFSDKFIKAKLPNSTIKKEDAEDIQCLKSLSKALLYKILKGAEITLKGELNA